MSLETNSDLNLLETISTEEMDLMEYWENKIELHIRNGAKLREDKAKLHVDLKDYSVLDIKSEGALHNKNKRQRHSRKNLKHRKIKSTHSSTKVNGYNKNRKETCPLRIAELAVPSKRQCLHTWKNKGKILPHFMVDRLKQIVLDEKPVIQVSDAITCFKSRKRKPRRMKSVNVKQEKRLECCKIFAALFGWKIINKLEKPLIIDLNPDLKRLADIISKDISNILRNRNKGSHLNCVNEFQDDVVKKVVVWIADILEETSYKILVNDLRELEEEEGPVLDILDALIQDVLDFCEPEDYNKDEFQIPSSHEESVKNSEQSDMERIENKQDSEDFIDKNIATFILENILLNVVDNVLYNKLTDIDIINNFLIELINEAYDAIDYTLIEEIKSQNDINHRYNENKTFNENLNKDGHWQIRTESDQVKVNNDKDNDTKIVKALNKKNREINTSSTDTVSNKEIDQEKRGPNSIDIDTENGLPQELNKIDINYTNKEDVPMDQKQKQMDIIDQELKEIEIKDINTRYPMDQQQKEIDVIDTNTRYPMDEQSKEIDVIENNTRYATDGQPKEIDVITSISIDNNTEYAIDQQQKETDVIGIDKVGAQVDDVYFDSENNNLNEENRLENSSEKKATGREENIEVNTTSESADDDLKKVKFSGRGNNLTDIISNREMNGDPIIHQTNTNTTESKIELNNQRQIPIRLLGPNLSLLSNADEIWPENLQCPLSKSVASVNKSVTSLGNIIELDEQITPSPKRVSSEIYGLTNILYTDYYNNHVKEKVDYNTSIDYKNYTIQDELNEITANGDTILYSGDVKKPETKFILTIKHLPNIDIDPDEYEISYKSLKENETQMQHTPRETSDKEIQVQLTITKKKEQHLVNEGAIINSKVYRHWCDGLLNVADNLEAWSVWIQNATARTDILIKKGKREEMTYRHQHLATPWLKLKQDIDADAELWQRLRLRLTAGSKLYLKFYKCNKVTPYKCICNK